jgi:alpha-L-rhamnosidase
LVLFVVKYTRTLPELYGCNYLLRLRLTVSGPDHTGPFCFIDCWRLHTKKINSAASTVIPTMKFIPCIIILLFSVFNGFSQHIAAEIMTKKWEAFWIAAQNEPAHDYGVYNFRKVFELPAKPSSFVIHVSADNRYKLFVNQQLVSLGPSRSDLFHWKFETVDIASFLQSGKNVITALVWNFGDQRPEPQVSLRTAFILQGNSKTEFVVNTDKSWKAKRDLRYQPLKPDLLYTYYVAGPGEQVDYRLDHADWMKLNYDDSAWKASATLFNGLPKGVFDWTAGWMLEPRDIPALELKQERLKEIRLAEGMPIPKNFLSGKESLTIPPNKKIKLLLDQGYLTNAYPVISFSLGNEAVITMGYAESLYRIETSGDWRTHKQKGNRNEVEGKKFVGVKDKLISNGQQNQIFTPLHWRTFRYLQLEIETKAEPLQIKDLHGIFTGFPFEQKSQFETGDESLKKILETGWRTARLCAAETYMDCPYYEQLQYVGDTRIQALVSLYNTGNDTLMRNAITQLDHSRMAEGITLSRYPTATAQQIPTFSLWWIGMLHDYWMYGRDEMFVQDKLPGMRHVLDFFKTYQLADGSLKNAPYWEFTDWATGDGWSHGVAPVGKDGSSAALDLQLCWAYQLAAQLEEHLGMKEYAQQFRIAERQLRETIRNKYWSEQRQLFADTQDKMYYSQHTNSLAILTGVVEKEEAVKLMEKILSTKSMTQATIYFKFYVHAALMKVGMGDRYLQLLSDWREQLANGLTTWAEISDHNNARSDCHAWGASPNIELFRMVLGIDSDAPGFKKVKIQPNLGGLTRASGKIPHPKGEILVSYLLTDQKWKVDITLPTEITGRFVFNNKEYLLQSGKNHFNF